MMTILALVLLGFALHGFSAGDPEEAVAGSTSQRESTADGENEESATGRIPDMGEGTSSEATAATEVTQNADGTIEQPEVGADPTDTAEPVALQECRSEVAAGEDWAGATADSASHWKQHYGSSMAYNDGDITLKEAEENFAASKAKGAGDIKAVGSTKKAYENAVGSCDSLSTADVPDSFTEAAEACAARAQALSEVLPVGSEVNGDWAAHLKMMKGKSKVDPKEYYERWQMMVAMAPDGMGPYEKAVKALDEVPTCPSA